MKLYSLLEGVDGATIKNHQVKEVIEQLQIDIIRSPGNRLEEISKEIVMTIEYVKGIQRDKYEGHMASSWKFNKLEIDAIVENIIDGHFQYIKENAVIIYVLMQKVALKHGENHPELKELNTALFLFLHDLLNQVKKQEQVLFPIIKQLTKKMDYSGYTSYSTFYFIKDFVIDVLKEHLATCKYLKLFGKLTNGYVLPDDASDSYKYLYVKMNEFEDNLLQYIHLENNVLFPITIAVDERSRKNNTRIVTYGKRTV